MIEDGPEEDTEPMPAPEGAAEDAAPTGEHLPAAALLDPPESLSENEAEPDPAEETPPPEEPAPEEPLPAGPTPEPLPHPILPPEPPKPEPAPPAYEPPPALAPAPAPRRRFSLWRTIRRVVAILLVFALIGPPLGVIFYKFIPPPFTWLMVERLVQGQGLTKQWTPLSDIDPSLSNAVIAGEDANFCEHHGFDFQAMQAAMRANAHHPGKVRGGSTISQQVAKNVFLWPSRDYVRKGLEAYFTILIEAIWGKRRIMEMYLNEVEWGPGTYGAQAAARRYFGEDASDIDPGEASRLAAILPSPLKWKAVNPGRYVQKRSRRIDAAAGTVREDGLAGCLKR